MTFEEKSAILNQAPDEEPSRQFFFIERCKEIIAEKAAEKGRPLTACVNTFGCQMNAKDSEKLIGILKKIGYQEQLTEDADFVLYNTCTVREHANVRVYGRLGVLKKYKDENPDMIIALCGCMMQEEEVVAKIRQSYRHVDLIFGTHNIYNWQSCYSIALQKIPCRLRSWMPLSRLLKICLLSASSNSNAASTSCTAVIISAATVSFHM